MIWEFGYRRNKMEKIYRRIRTVYTIANTALWYAGGDTVRKRRLTIEVEASCAAVEEAANPPDHPEGEPLELEGV